MEFDEAIAELGGVGDQCVSLIGKEQQSQIDALKTRIASLERQLRERDDQIAILETGQHQLNQIDATVSGIIGKFRPRHEPNADYLAEISEMSDLSAKIQYLFKLIQKDLGRSNRLLVAMLRGHVEFLTRLGTTPELLSQFCVSSTTGQTFVPSETGQIILEQARRTSHFLGGPANDGNREIGSVAEALDLRIDLGNRVEAVKELLKGNTLSPLEVNVLFLQEVAITNALRRRVEQLQTGDSGSGESLEAFRIIAKAIGKKDSEFTPRLLAQYAQNLAIRCAKLKQTRADRGWETWANSLYYAVTGIDEALPPPDLQIAIEEAALTAVGSVRRKKRAK